MISALPLIDLKIHKKYIIAKFISIKTRVIEGLVNTNEQKILPDISL